MTKAEDLAYLFASQPLSAAAIQFLPAWLLALFAGRRAESIGIRPAAEVSGGLTYLALLLWAGISASRTLGFWQMLAWCHGPEPREMYVVAMSNLGAGAITCCIVVVALTVRRRPAARLGLRGTRYWASITLILVTLIDAASILVAFHLFTRPAGLPLPLSLVH